MKGSFTILSLIFIGLSACSHKGEWSGNTSSVDTGNPKISFFMTKPQPTEPVILVADSEYAGRKPQNLRADKKLRMSGSSTFGALGLREVAKGLKKNEIMLYVFDLRQESHGLINDIPVTWHADREWAAADLNHDESIRRERRLLGDLRVGDSWNGKEIKSIETEESMVRSAGHHYVRLAVTEHVRPTDSTVDLFLQTVREIPEKSWVHFHDRTGKGRSTLFMILYDMIHNAGKDSYEVIVQRNLVLSQDLDLLTVGDEKDWKYPFQKERLEFVRQFYNYAKEHPRAEKKLWSEWVL